MVVSEAMAPREKQFNFRLSEEEDARLQTLMMRIGLDGFECRTNAHQAGVRPT